MNAQLSDYVEIPFARSSTNKKDSGRPSQQFFDINLQFNTTEKSGDLDTIVFQNYYVSSISIYQQNSSMNYTAVLENYKLMENPYAEGKSQCWHTIHVKEMNSNYIKGRPMRIVMFQPATIWNKYEIRNLKFLGRGGGGGGGGAAVAVGLVSGTGAPKSGSPSPKNAYKIPSKAAVLARNKSNSPGSTEHLIELLFSDFCILKSVAVSQVDMRSRSNIAGDDADVEDDTGPSDVIKKSVKKKDAKKK